MQKPETSGPADPEAVKDFWLQCARGADSRGHLEMLPTRKASTPREAEQARRQNYALTRRVFGMPDGYDRIQWGNGDDAA